jgi:hypothetical protein
MGTTQYSGPDFDSRIERLHSAADTVDPTEFQDLVAQREQTTVAQAQRLWEIATRQSILVDMRVADGDDSAFALQLQTYWSTAGESFLKALIPNLTSEDAETTLRNYWAQNRASEAASRFIPPVREAEEALGHQLRLIQFHWDDGNAYRQREQELSTEVSDATDAASAQAAATKLIAENERYRRIYLSKLLRATSEVKAAFARCERFVPLFPREHYPEIFRWAELTALVVAAREAAVAHITRSLDFDASLPNQVLAGNVKEDFSAADRRLVLNESASTRVKEYVLEAAELLKNSAQVETRFAEERDDLARRLIGEPTPPSDAAAERERTENSTSHKRLTHPLERRPWFRVVRVGWWVTAAILILFAAAITPTWSAFVVAAMVIVGVLIGVQRVAFYILLGRTTLWEPAGSGFIDVDVFEEEVADRSSIVEANERFTAVLRNLRSRYGRRVPVDVIRGSVERELSSIQEEKRRVLVDADSKGASISISELRKTLNCKSADYPEGIQRERFRHSCELLVTRLEVKYGPEIPASAADAEAELLSPLGPR